MLETVVDTLEPGVQSHPARLLLVDHGAGRNRLGPKVPSLSIFAKQQHVTATQMIVIKSPIPFERWGLDLVTNLPPAMGNQRFLLVAIDYFTKWMEAEPLATISGDQIVRFF